MILRRPVRERLLSMLVVDLESLAIVDGSPCWMWRGHLRSNGYARIGTGGRHGKQVYIHRAAYELWFGPVPAGLDIDHLCRNRACANPAHLEAVTRSVNLRRGRHGGGRPVGYRHSAKTIGKIREAALNREQRRRVPWATEVQARPEMSTGDS